MKASEASATVPPSRRVTGPRWITISNGSTTICSAVSFALSKRAGCDMNQRVLTIVIAVLCYTAASAQTPTFRLQVEYVEVDARVTDSKGNFVRDLTKDDFQVL